MGKFLSALYSTLLLSSRVRKINAFEDMNLSGLFLKASSDGDFTPGTAERALRAQLPWKLRLSKAKFSSHPWRPWKSRKASRKSPERAINDPCGKAELAATSASACGDELQVLPSHTSVKFPFTLIFMGSHSNISKVCSSLLHYSWGR